MDQMDEILVIESMRRPESCTIFFVFFKKAAADHASIRCRAALIVKRSPVASSASTYFENNRPKVLSLHFSNARLILPMVSATSALAVLCQSLFSVEQLRSNFGDRQFFVANQ